VLKDVKNIDLELARHAKKFIQRHVKLDPLQKSIELPGLIKMYWMDFGGNRAKVLKNLSHLSGHQFAKEIKNYIFNNTTTPSSSIATAEIGCNSNNLNNNNNNTNGQKPKINFTNIDWTPVFIL
jgi:hypothetical protein